MESDLVGQLGGVGLYSRSIRGARRSCITLGALSYTVCAVAAGRAVATTASPVVTRAIVGFVSVRAVLCAADCPSNGAANDKEGHDDNPDDAPSPAVPRHCLSDGFVAGVRRFSLAGVANGSRTVIERGAALVWHHAVWRGGWPTIVGLLEQTDIVPFLRGRKRRTGMREGEGNDVR